MEGDSEAAQSLEPNPRTESLYPWGEGRAKPTGERQTRGPGGKKDFLAIPAIPLQEDATCHDAALPRKTGCPWAGQHQG